MPVPPSTWIPGPLSPQQLNTDLVSFDGTGFSPNGIVFHSHRPVLYETVTSSRALGASTGGTWSTIAGTGTSAFSVLDTAALFSTGSDDPGVYAAYSFTPTVNGSGGQASVIGGYCLASFYATSAQATGTAAACGAGLSVTGTASVTLYSQGAIQTQGTGKTACAPYLDLINAASSTSGSGLVQVTQTFGTSGTWIAPTGVTSVLAECWGAGGGGGGGNISDFSIPLAGGGGGGGEYAANSSYPVVPGNTYNFTVGAAGTGGSGTNGMAGGNTIFDTSGSGITAHGGGPGTNGSGGGEGGAAGTGSGAATHFNGGAGATGPGGGSGGGGGGSGGNASVGNNGSSATGGAAVTDGGPGGNGGGSGSSPASGPGGGGGGGDGSGGTGGNGWAGQVSLTWYQTGGTTVSTAWEPSAFVLDASASSLTPPSNSSDTAGITSRAMFAWAGVSSGGTTVATVPTPQQTWPTITSTLLNGSTGPKQALTFLNSPPLMRIAQTLTTSIPNTANTVISFGTAVALPDTYNGWNGTSTYTTALPGLYLVAPTVAFAGTDAGQRYCGVTVNGSTSYRGPSYAAVQGANHVTSVTQLRVLDLQATDTVSAFAYQSSGGALALTSTYSTYLVLAMLCPFSSGSGALVTAPPITSFRWSAGLSLSQLPALLSLHLGNDLSFLVNRPYFTGYQGTAQSGFANNSWNAVTIDTVGGLLHGSNGDNYAGWNATNNVYVAQQPGWYLVISEVFGTAPGLTTGYMTAGISVATSGGITPSISPDSYQSVSYPLTTGTAPGASAVGLYYLAIGESVSPVIRADAWTASTWGTTSSSTIRSQFSVIWLCE